MTTGKWPGMGLVAGALLVSAATAYGGATIKIDDTRSINLGAASRGSYSTVQDAAPNGNDWSQDFNLDSARVYLSGDITDIIKFELNTECTFCGNSSLQDYAVLDAIVKFNLAPTFNIWAGRLLVPADRQELNGPYYSTTYDAYKTPFFPSDFSTTFGTGGAGVYARDNGFNIWGAAAPEGRFQYVAGIFQGLQSSTGVGPNQDDNLLYATRLAYNFLSVEKNPGYYTSGSYFGKAGDVFTIGAAVQYQKDGSGTFLNPGDFTGTVVDVLFEKVFGGGGVFTLNGEYKDFHSDYSTAAFTDGGECFCMFDGNAYSVIALYLFGDTVGVGQFQPYLRYSDVEPNDSDDRDEFEVGVNYVIDGFNARISMFYQHGNIATLGLNYAPTATGDDVDAFKIGLQVQL